MNLDKKNVNFKKSTEIVTPHTIEEKEEWILLKNYQFDDSSFYRIVNEEGYQDYRENKILRSCPGGTPSNMVGTIDLGHRTTPFPSFSKGQPDFSYADDNQDNYIFESNILMYKRGDKNPVKEKLVKGKHWAYRPIDQKTGNTIIGMNSDMIKNIFKLDKDGNLYLKK